jgi:MFS family permease
MIREAESRDAPRAAPDERAARRRRAAERFGLERNVLAVSGAVFLLGAGEELWKKFLPKYLEALGAGPVAVGFFGTTKDFLDAVYQYPGGWLADRFGRRRAFLLFVGLASVGYAIYLASPSWPFVFAGLVFAMAWSSMASPAIFAVVGDALPKERRAMGFTVQSILKRVPMAFAPPLGGAMIAALGVTGGVRAGLAIMLGLAAATVLLVLAINIPVDVGPPANIRGVWRSFHGALKRLLVSDIVIRTCEGMAEILVVLYATNVVGVTFVEYGALVAVQMATAIAVYIPAAKIADRTGRKPFVIATFVCFALFPVAVALSTSFVGLVAAFAVGGLREIGEPARKAMIVDFAEPHLRARSVGLYYLIRSLSITPAAAVGGALYTFDARLPFVVAGAVGLLGVLVFAATVEERYAG